MIPYLLGGAAAIGALVLGTTSKRKHRHDPRTAATQRLKIVDARHAVTRRMSAANPSEAMLQLVFRKDFGGEPMVRVSGESIGGEEWVSAGTTTSGRVSKALIKKARAMIRAAKTNPKRRAKRKVVKIRRKVDGKWRTTTTVTRTVKKVKTNPKGKSRATKITKGAYGNKYAVKFFENGVWRVWDYVPTYAKAKDSLKRAVATLGR